MDTSRRTTLLKLARGEISLMQATGALGLPDAGHTLREMAEAGLTPYQLPDKKAQDQAIAGLDALRAAIKPVRGVKARITRRDGDQLVATFTCGTEVTGTLKDIVATLREAAVDISVVTMPDKNEEDSPTTGQRIQLYACLKRIVRIGPQNLIDRDDFASAAQLDGQVSVEQLAHWVEDGALFAVEHNGIELYPLYGLDTEPPLRPRPVLGRIIAAMHMDAWHVAIWFMAGCGMLDGRRPQDVLSTDPQAVLEAAIDQGMGITHG